MGPHERADPAGNDGATATAAWDASDGRAVVLVVEDDPGVAEVARMILTDQGYRVEHRSWGGRAVREAVNRLEPDCVLLDSAGRHGYGASWDTAAWLQARGRPVPTVMFTVLNDAADEAEARASARSRGAAFAAVLRKPFDLEDMVATVAGAVGLSRRFDRGAAAEAGRTAALRDRLSAAGATEVRTSEAREWVTFRTSGGVLAQLYWWEREGVYYLLRYRPTGGGTEPLGRFFDLGAAVEAAMDSPRL